MTDFQTIRAAVPRAEILAQLAEECAELGQAALKLRRAIMDGTNPTPVTVYEAENRLRKEIADVLTCMELGVGDVYDVSVSEEIKAIMHQKLTRWARRLEA